MSWLLIVGGAWTAAAVPLALVIGRSVRLADLVEAAQPPAVPDVVPAAWSGHPAGSR
jgi:hypothetical protein